MAIRMDSTAPSTAALALPERTRTLLARLARPRVGFAVLALAAAGLILNAGRGLTLFGDDWAFATLRRGWTPDAFLAPHNEHVSIVLAIVYKLLFVTVGIAHYWPYRVAGLLLHLACAWLVFRLAERRLGGWGALAPATAILFLGSGWEILLWPFTLGTTVAVVGGLAAFAAVERGDRRGDVLACAALVFSASGSAVGVPFLAALTTELLLRRAWRRLWVSLVPIAYYGAWYAAYGRSGTVHDRFASPASFPGYMWRAAQADLGALGGIVASERRLVLLLVAALAVLRMIRAPRTISPRLVALFVALLGFWSLLAAGRSVGDVAVSRYMYVACVLLVLILVELGRGLALTRRAAAVVIVLVAVSVPTNVRALTRGAEFLRGPSSSLRAELGALEALHGPLPATLVPNETWDPNLTAANYPAVKHALGSPADAPGEIAGESPQARTDTDFMISHAQRTVARPAQAGSRCGPLGHGETVLTLPGRTAFLRARGAVEVWQRRFGDDFAGRPLTLGAGTWSLRLADVRAPGHWHLRVRSVGGAGFCISA
jgi:hypothetical protein